MFCHAVVCVAGIIIHLEITKNSIQIIVLDGAYFLISVSKLICHTSFALKNVFCNLSKSVKIIGTSRWIATVNHHKLNKIYYQHYQWQSICQATHIFDVPNKSKQHSTYYTHSNAWTADNLLLTANIISSWLWSYIRLCSAQTKLKMWWWHHETFYRL